MCRIYRLFVLLLLPATALHASAETLVSPTACNQQVCVFNVTSPKLMGAPCASFSVLVAYSESNGATLIQCTSHAGEENNKSFIYDRNDLEVNPFIVEGSRFIEAAYLSEALESDIADRSGTISLCSTKEHLASELSGVLHLAEKEPSNSESNPYCYRIRSVSVAREGLIVRDDRGHTIPSSPKTVAAKWNPIREKLSPYITDKVSLDSSLRRPAFVKSPRAQLFTGPNLDAVSKMYLVKGDKVDMLSDSNENMLCRIRYITRDGRSIDRWVQQQDLDIQTSANPKQ